MARQEVTSHIRRIRGKWKSVHKYIRKKRPKSKKRIVRKTSIRLYPVTDEYGQFKGYSRKRGK